MPISKVEKSDEANIVIIYFEESPIPDRYLIAPWLIDRELTWTPDRMFKQNYLSQEDKELLESIFAIRSVDQLRLWGKELKVYPYKGESLNELIGEIMQLVATV